MKGLLFILSLFSWFSYYSQFSEEPCLDARWLTIHPSVTNDYLFPNDTPQNIFVNILDLAAREKVHFYWMSQDYHGITTSWFPYFNYSTDSSISNSNELFSTNNHRIQFKFEFDMLWNNQGEDSIIIDSNGIAQYAYPEPVYWNFNFWSINTVLIKESNEYVKEKDTVEFLVSEIGFVITNIKEETQTFWIDVQELKQAMKAERLYDWYKKLIEKQYYGDQYAQKLCEE